MNRTARQIGLSMAIVSAALFGCGPIGFVPGTRLGGTQSSAPADWSAVEIGRRIRIETAGGWLPRVHHVWAVEVDGEIYATGQPTNSWVERGMADPNIRIRVGDLTYERTLERIEDEALIERIEIAYVEKYQEEIGGGVADDEPRPWNEMVRWHFSLGAPG